MFHILKLEIKVKAQVIMDISPNALSGKNGIYTHVSYREDKSDMHPQPDLVTMLQSLSQ